MKYEVVAAEIGFTQSEPGVAVAVADSANAANEASAKSTRIGLLAIGDIRLPYGRFGRASGMLACASVAVPLKSNPGTAWLPADREPIGEGEDTTRLRHRHFDGSGWGVPVWRSSCR